jgi:hypothetical protein
MPDDFKNRGPLDRSRVNVNEEWERRYWAEEFGCTEDELRDAVARVGVMVRDVRRAVGK